METMRKVTCKFDLILSAFLMAWTLNLQAQVSTNVRATPQTNVNEIKVELNSILSLLRDTQVDSSLPQEINLVRKTADWVLKCHPMIQFQSSGAANLEVQILSDLPQDDMRVAKALLELARYAHHLSTEDIHAILSFYIDLERLDITPYADFQIYTNTVPNKERVQEISTPTRSSDDA